MTFARTVWASHELLSDPPPMQCSGASLFSVTNIVYTCLRNFHGLRCQVPMDLPALLMEEIGVSCFKALSYRTHSSPQGPPCPLSAQPHALSTSPGTLRVPPQLPTRSPPPAVHLDMLVCSHTCLTHNPHDDANQGPALTGRTSWSGESTGTSWVKRSLCCFNMHAGRGWGCNF